MRFTRTRRVVAVAAAAGAIGVGFAASAQAAEGTWTVTNTRGCVALEKIELIGGHDYMAEDPIADDGSCAYGIWNNNTGEWAASNFPTTSPSQSQWVWDGPGESLTVCVYATYTGYWVCGPSN
ncbi:hypothetical protein KGA66_21065 [Actinocrinis puniceicyclus]|uniref:Secreted protein n=1 Tax=Actinocrinis puniceicyclus TaxID=977794 RepID=A0A8J7WUT8_9ACTN|nr:hypothetical protein [Actinocrinis puniceicyclus]MBS2965554.1 hypothetical protein [Actinocrinis puniceicyclus]